MPSSPSETAAGKTRVAIIGTGALGSTLLEHLVRQQAYSVLLIDPDRVEDRNLILSGFLQRAMDHRTAASPVIAGHPAPYKAELLANYAKQEFDTDCSAQTSEIADIGWQTLQGVDAFYCCTDNALSRAETTYIARVLRKPMIDGAVFGEGIPEGRVTSFSPAPEAACYLCGMTEDSRASVLGYAASGALGCRVPDEAPSMTGTILTIRHTARVMSVTSFPSWEQRASTALKVFPEKAAVEEPIQLTRSVTCPWHDALPERLDSLPWHLPLRSSLSMLGKHSQRCELQLAWPVCVEASCATCGARSWPFLRVARIRNTACSNCGERTLQSLRAVHRIRADDPIAERSPQELGQPDRHLYWLREPVGMHRRPEGAR